MEPGFLLAMLALGAVSGVHCLGMCGGIVAAWSLKGIPVREEKPRPPLGRLAAFNAGRLATYAALGTAAGAFGAALEAQVALYVAANVVLVLAGLHLAGFGVLSRLEALLVPLWRTLQPFTAAGNGFVAGLAWGFIPCGMVYGALAAASLAGSPAGGAAAMLAFGLGTLPFLAAAGLAAARARAWLRGALARAVAGTLVLGFGIYGLAHAGGLADGIRRGILCL